jgi:hypothetical protein
MLKSYVNAGMLGKSQSSVGMSTGIQLPQSGIAIPACFQLNLRENGKYKISLKNHLYILKPVEVLS